MESEDPIVQICCVSKSFESVYDSKKALDEVNLDIYAGRIVGLVGPNGSGKSTLLRHIVGLYLPDTGQCRTFEKSAENLGPEELAKIGYVHQEGGLIPWMRVAQIIRYVKAYYPNWNHKLEADYIRTFDVETGARVGSLSPGERQKLAILLAIGFEPELLILDEPANALDPLARAKFLDLLLETIQAENRTIIISSHILSDIEKVVDHLVIIKQGRILRDCGLDTLQEQYLRVRFSSASGTIPEVIPIEGIIDSKGDKYDLVVMVKDVSEEDVSTLAQQLGCGFELEHLSLEEAYRLVMTEEGER